MERDTNVGARGGDSDVSCNLTFRQSTSVIFSRLSPPKKKVLCNIDIHITHIYIYINIYIDIIYKHNIYILFCDIKFKIPGNLVGKHSCEGKK